MYAIELFMKNQQAQPEPVRYPATTLFRDKDGKVLEWEITSITSAENDEIRMACSKARSGMTKKELENSFDVSLYNAKLAAACTTEPNLRNVKLQDSYGVKCAEDLLRKMLPLPGEYDRYVQKVQETCGFGEQFAQDVDTVKN